MCKIFFSSPKPPDWPWGPPSLLFKGRRGPLFREKNDRGVRISIHLHLVSRFRLNGGLAPLSFPANTVCSGTALPLIYIRLKGLWATNKTLGFCWDVTSCSLVNLLTHCYNRPNLRREHELHPGNMTRGGHRKR